MGICEQKYALKRKSCIPGGPKTTSGLRSVASPILPTFCQERIKFAPGFVGSGFVPSFENVKFLTNVRLNLRGLNASLAY